MEPRGKTVALVVAAGSGSRAGGEGPKQYRRIAGRSMLAHALDHIRHPEIDSVLVVIGEGQESLYSESAGRSPLPPTTVGGATRQQSVRNGLLEIGRTGGADHVLIHDAARPMLPQAVIGRLLAALRDHRGAVPVLPVVDTLATQEAGLGDAVPRDSLVRVQTPQAFHFREIVAAHDAWQGGEASDDAQVARAAGMNVATVAGDPLLEKLTYSEDFRRAEALVSQRLETRTGMGFDVHAFGVGESVRLGGVSIPHERGLAGHSDADVALHALTDALLGAIGEGDIGDHFPPSDPQWRGADSSRFVEHACQLIRDRGGRIVHCDITIICEEPRIGPHRAAIRNRIAELLGLAVARVSVKATTTEKLGFTGRGEGIAAQAVANVALAEEQ